MLNTTLYTSMTRLLAFGLLHQLPLSSARTFAFVSRNHSNEPLLSLRRKRLHRFEFLHTSFGKIENERRSVSASEMIGLESMQQMDKLAKFYKSNTSVAKPVLLQSQEEVSKYILENFDNILFDCDGVLYRGPYIIPNAPMALQSLMNLGKKIFFVTNNAASNRKELRDKLAKLMSCANLSEEQMIGSAYSASRYLSRELRQEQMDVRESKPHVHVIGTEGLCEEIRSAGFIVSGGPGPDPPELLSSSTVMSRSDLENYEFLEDTKYGIDAVVIGLDTAFNYRKLCIAVGLLQRYPDAILVATNKDSYDLVGSDARHLPGNGAIVAAVEAASERIAVVTGKPSPILANLIADEHGLDQARTLMVGDRLDTDIRFGLEGGMTSALVLTGCTSAEKVASISASGGTIEEPIPSIIFPHMGLMGPV